jgi:formylmethanofuran dehydrogenase subunit B
MPSFICPFCSLNCSGSIPGRSGKTEFDVNWLCKAGNSALHQAVDTSHSPEIDGKRVSWEDGFVAATQIITKARFPLVLLSGGVSCEAQQKGVLLAGKLHAGLDAITPFSTGVSPRVINEAGLQTSTLGGVPTSRMASLFWGIDAGEKMPSPNEKISACVKGGTSIDINYTGKPGWDHPQSINIKPGSTLSLIQKLRLGLRDPEKIDGPIVHRLLDFFQSADAGAVFIGKDFHSEGIYAVIELEHFLGDLWQKHVWRIFNLDFDMNAVGAAEVLTAFTGYSQTVIASQVSNEIGIFPIQAEDLVNKKLVDCVVLIGNKERLGKQNSIPSVVITPQKPEHQPSIWLPCSQVGIGSTGRVIRFDGIPLQLDAYHTSENPSAEKVLERLLEGVPL